MSLCNLLNKRSALTPEVSRDLQRLSGEAARLARGPRDAGSLKQLAHVQMRLGKLYLDLNMMEKAECMLRSALRHADRSGVASMDLMLGLIKLYLADALRHRKISHIQGRHVEASNAMYRCAVIILGHNSGSYPAELLQKALKGFAETCGFTSCALLDVTPSYTELYLVKGRLRRTLTINHLVDPVFKVDNVVTFKE